jgi:hypothetical protein
MNRLTEKLRPHVLQILADAERGNRKAQQIIDLHRMHCACPGDPGAPALCEAAFDDWRRANELG